MEDLTLYPIWQRLPRPRFFPQDPRLDRLLASNYDRGLDGFKLTLRRREARDLRKGLFGPKGSRVVPSSSDDSDGVMWFDLRTAGGSTSLTSRDQRRDENPERWRPSLSHRKRAGAVVIRGREFHWRFSRCDARAG